MLRCICCWFEFGLFCVLIYLICLGLCLVALQFVGCVDWRALFCWFVVLVCCLFAGLLLVILR